MKHLFYAFYVSFYAGAMFVTGLFFGQFMERRWAAREAAEAADVAADGPVVDEELVFEEAPIVLSGSSHHPSR